MIDSVVGLVQEHVDSGVFSIFWINSRTLAPCKCFTVESGSPGILKSMSSSILPRTVSLSVLSVVISRCTSGAARSAISCLSGCPDRSWVCATRISPDRFVWALITLGVISSCPDRSEEQSSSCEDFSLISLDQDVSPLSINTSCLSSGSSDRSQMGFGIDWKNFAHRETSPRGCWATSSGGWRATFEPILVQSWRKKILGGGRGDMYASHIRLLQSSISQLLEYNKLEVFLDGRLHSIESDRNVNPFRIARININPIHRVLVPLPCTVHVSC